MKKEGLIWLLVIVIAILNAFVCGTIIYDRQRNVNNTPFYEKFETDLQHPDTAQVYWDRGVMYLMFKTDHTEVDTVEEDNQ